MANYEDLIEEQRRSHRDAYRTNSSEKDKIVVSIAAAALGVSIAFLTDLESDASWHGALIAAWIAFGAAVAAVLASFEVNSRQINRSIDYIDEWKEKPEGDRPKDGAYFITVRERKIRVASALDTVSIVCLIAGIVLIILFVSLNLQQRSEM